MNARSTVRRTVLLAAVSSLALGAHSATAPQSDRTAQQAAPSFRSGVTAIPIDVRVIDSSGKPITNLRQEDFTILEDGVPQTIAHFAAETLVAREPLAALRARPETRPFTALPQNHRVFLIIVGTRGFGDVQRHPETLDALLDFVRHKLLPQDQVALLANNRGIDFTSDHEKVARLLEVFRGSGGAARLGGIQGPAAASPSTIPNFASPAALEAEPAIETALGFEDYIKARGGQPLDKLESLFYGISYLRFMEGEKHLIFLTERGPTPSWDQANALSRVANNARVALNTIQSDVRIFDSMSTHPSPMPTNQSGADTGSIPTAYNYNPTAPVNQPPPKPRNTELGSPERDGSPLAGGSTSAASSAASLGFGGIYDLRHIALQTGGLSSMWTDAAPALARIDDATRTHYLLAYYPSNSDWSGRFRSVSVVVNRPGAKVLFRHGYSALEEVATFDRRRVVADSRIEAAGSQVVDIRDLDVTFTPSFIKNASAPGGEVTVPMSIDATRLSWGQDQEGKRTANLDVAIYCADGNQKIIGQTRRKLNLALTDETFAKTLKERISRTMRLTVTGTPRYVKVIVFDYDADRLGSTMVKLK